MTRLVPAHFDGEHILLDLPVEIKQNDKLWVQISDEDPEDEERRDWAAFGRASFARMYEDEPDLYTEDMIIERNPLYRDPRPNNPDNTASK